MIKVQKVIWLPEIEDKLLQKHHVLAEEVEEVLFDHSQIYFVERGHHEGENMYTACRFTAL